MLWILPIIMLCLWPFGIHSRCTESFAFHLVHPILTHKILLRWLNLGTEPTYT